MFCFVATRLQLGRRTDFHIWRSAVRNSRAKPVSKRSVLRHRSIIHLECGAQDVTSTATGVLAWLAVWLGELPSAISMALIRLKVGPFANGGP